jgi:hypothetical protein
MFNLRDTSHTLVLNRGLRCFAALDFGRGRPGHNTIIISGDMR